MIGNIGLSAILPGPRHPVDDIGRLQSLAFSDFH